MFWKSEQWEDAKLSSNLIQYAVTDVFTSRHIFETISKSPCIKNVTADTPAGSRVALLVQEGGDIVAYGKIAANQVSPFKEVYVKVPNWNSVIIDIDILLKPLAAAILHVDHTAISTSTTSKSKQTKLGIFTLGQLQAAFPSICFSMVAPTSLLRFDNCNMVCK